MITSPDISQLANQLQTAGQARDLLNQATALTLQALDELGAPGATSILDTDAINAALDVIHHAQTLVFSTLEDLPDDPLTSIDEPTRNKVRLAAQETVDNLALVENTLTKNTGWVETFVDAFHTVVGAVGQGAKSVIEPLTKPLAEALWPVAALVAVVLVAFLVFKHAVGA